MSIPSDQLELLSQQINHAHRSAVSEELSRRGLSEIGHPMLLTVLEGYQSDDPEGHAQRTWLHCCTSPPPPWQTP